ncbi:MAG: diphthine synthase [Candidatus Woesearchaeota archaeon]
MSLTFIGLGLEKEDISLKALNNIKNSDVVYLEHYTSKLENSIDELEKFYEKKLKIANRDLVEKGDEILNESLQKKVAFLVVGDVFSATTHTDLLLRAKKAGIKTSVINNVSVINAVTLTGLDIYKFGKTTSIVFPDNNWYPKTPYSSIKDNLSIGLHTLCLLDIKMAEPSIENLKKGLNKPEKPRFMTVNKGLEVLLKLEEIHKENVISKNTFVLGVARVGLESQKIVYGKIKDVINCDFGRELHSIIIPGKLNEIEKEILNYHNIY